MPDTFQVACPECDSANRFPRSLVRHRWPSVAGVAQGYSQASRLTSAASASGSTSPAAIVADFWAAWCGPCRAMAPAFEQAARELEPQARFIKIDVDAEPRLAAEFGVQGVPALFVFKNGQVAARRAGAMDFSSLRRWVEQASA